MWIFAFVEKKKKFWEVSSGFMDFWLASPNGIKIITVKIQKWINWSMKIIIGCISTCIKSGLQLPPFWSCLTSAVRSCEWSRAPLHVRLLQPSRGSSLSSVAQLPNRAVSPYPFCLAATFSPPPFPNDRKSLITAIRSVTLWRSMDGIWLKKLFQPELHISGSGSANVGDRGILGLKSLHLPLYKSCFIAYTSALANMICIVTSMPTGRLCLSYMVDVHIGPVPGCFCFCARSGERVSVEIVVIPRLADIKRC